MRPLIIACLCVGLIVGMGLALYLSRRPARCPNPKCRRPLPRPGVAFCPACGAPTKGNHVA